MIFSSCPYCDETQVFGWECGDPGGWFPSRCPKCAKVMWVEATSLGGETLTHEEFLSKIVVQHPGTEAEVEEARATAKVQSTVVYHEKEAP